MGAPPGDDTSADIAGRGTWRDELCLRAAKVSTFFYVLAIVVVLLTFPHRWQRLVLTFACLTCCLVVGILGFTGLPKGKLRPWFVVAPAIISSVVGFGIAGFLAGPAAVLMVTLTLAGLLMGRRTMLALSLAAVIGISIIAWAMIHSLIPVPEGPDVSMRLWLPWVRTTTLTVFAIGLLGSVLLEVVGQLERSLEQARHETVLREAAEQARARAEIMAMANKQLETVGQLAAGIAHDFNNNLAAIIGSAELLKEEIHENADSAELLDDILASAQRGAQLTRQLLAYSRKAQMVRAPTDLHQLIDKTVGLLRRSIDPKVRVAIRLNADHASVLADASVLDNALLNLLVNARDAMPDGGQLTIATSSYEVVEASTGLDHGLLPGRYVLVEVIDTGEGIAADVLPNIFEPFFTTKPVGKGTGLGLAAVSGAIKSLKGSIEVESEPGCGTAFRILLPCDDTAVSMVSRKADQLTRGSGRVLLVDDDVLVRRAAATTLRSLGYEVTMANDGVEALDTCRSAPEPFQLVILDLRMPRMDGEATYEELHRLSPALPVLIWSGYGGELDVEALLRKGAAGFIQKPYSIVELSQVVSEAIHGRAKERAREESA